MDLLTDVFSWEVFIFVVVVTAVIVIVVYLYKNDKKMVVFFVVGGPGAGKGTQCAKMDKIYPNLISLSTGQLLRQMTKERKTERAIEIGRQMDNGELVNINATTELLQPEFKKHQNEGKNIFVIDGFPRSIEILDDWNKGMSGNEHIMPFVIELECPVNILRERLLARKRNDDTEDAIKKRICVFQEETGPVIEIFKEKNKHHKINSDRSINEIFNEMYQLLNPYYKWCIIKSNRLFPSVFDNEYIMNKTIWWINYFENTDIKWLKKGESQNTNDIDIDCHIEQKNQNSSEKNILTNGQMPKCLLTITTAQQDDDDDDDNDE